MESTSTPHGITTKDIGNSVLGNDILHFKITSQVPSRLSKHVSSSKKEQANWYNKLTKAWDEIKPPPHESKEAANLIIKTLHHIGKLNLEGFLAYYGLSNVPQTTKEGIEAAASPLPEGVQFELLTLPIHDKAIGDGDGFTAYVNVEESRETLIMSNNIRNAIKMMGNAHAAKDFAQEKLIRENVIAAGYRFLKLPNQQEILARKYRIRLRGVDAPEIGMPYGKEAKQVLVELIQGNCLKIHVYKKDHYGRCVGDVYFDGIFIQEQLLKRGCVWHYKAYDARPEFAKWEKEARAGRKGLWALPYPEKPWVWRKNNPNPHEK